MSPVLLLGLLGCQDVRGTFGLPDGAIAQVALVSGGEATVYVDLRRDAAGPRVRAAVGRHEIAQTFAASALGPEESTYHTGPGEGFHLRRSGERLELLRPRGDEAHWMPVLKGVERLREVRWINTARLSREDMRTLDTRLKEVIPLDVAVGDAVVDGDLDEWVGAAASPVERPSQVLAGMPDWSGPRDASFGVAGRASSAGLVLALRVRDDAHVLGQDRLELLSAGGVIRLPLPEHAQRVEGDGWVAAFSEPDWLGQSLELWQPDTAATIGRPPVVQFVDVDPGEGEVRLGSAASTALGELAAAR